MTWLWDRGGDFGTAFFRIIAASGVQQRWRDVGVGDQGRTDAPRVFVSGKLDHEGNMESGFVDGGLGSGKGHAVVGGEDDERVVVLAGLLEGCDELAESLVGAGAGLIVVCEFAAGFDGVREKGRNRESGGIIGDLGGAGIGLADGRIAKAVGFEFFGCGFVIRIAAVGVIGPEAEEKRLFGFLPEEGFAGIDPCRGVVAVGRAEVLADGVDGLGGDVEFADVGGAIAQQVQLGGKRNCGTAGEGGEFVIVMGVAELTVGVIVKPCEDDRAARGTGCGGGVGMGETNAVSCQCVEMGRLDHGRAITTGDRALVVGDEEDDVGRFACGGEDRAEQDKENGGRIHGMACVWRDCLEAGVTRFSRF